MTALSITIFANREALTEAAHETCITVLERALETKGYATLLGAGGSTPGPLYDALSETPLTWEAITVGLTDERWVPADHEASNEGLMRRTLLKNAAHRAKFLPMVTNAERPVQTEVSTVNKIYAEAAANCDLMILGMGPDAHTLSWFPEADGLTEALDPQTSSVVAAIHAKQSKVTGAYTKRMTLTLLTITNARNILLLMTGKEKRDTLEKAGPDMPIQKMIAAAGSRLSIYWAP